MAVGRVKFAGYSASNRCHTDTRWTREGGGENCLASSNQQQSRTKQDVPSIEFFADLLKDLLSTVFTRIHLNMLRNILPNTHPLNNLSRYESSTFHPKRSYI